MEEVQKNQSITEEAIQKLAAQLSGSLHFDSLHKTIYATDASVYQELPLAVAIPKTKEDLVTIITFANVNNISIVPRAAGTSLAGQCVGSGIIVDISKHFTEILEVNTEERWVRVQPGVIRNELNRFLAPLGFHFGPNTSTASRCMIGGMIGNNSCGTSSIVYGSTRDHIISLEVILSDGSITTFDTLDEEEFHQKCALKTLEGSIYTQLKNRLSDKAVRKEIKKEFPKTEIHRRNTGYAIDLLSLHKPFTNGGGAFNMCTLLAGSEGTLAFTAEAKLHIDPLPPSHQVVVAVHCSSIQESLIATQIAMAHQPSQCELVDKIILDCTKGNIEQRENRFFLEGDPAALVLVEFRGETEDIIQSNSNEFIKKLKESNLGFAYPIIKGTNTQKIWNLRNAGLGLLANIPGDKKAVACIEDTAVALEDLPAYIDEFTKMMKGFGQQAVYYAHAGAGELHLRPILNLNEEKDVQLFYEISKASAILVKKYRGSLSGEHGDGRLRAPFIPIMIGENNYALLKEIKSTWDPKNIFNPGKIVDAPAMNTSLRDDIRKTPKNLNIETKLDFSTAGGILRMAEKCNGSGDCRNPASTGATMCPSYQATKNEKDSTRARANTLRNFLTNPILENPFAHEEIKEVMDLCMSCKGCTRECPSNVDMSSMKAEYQYQYYKTNPRPLRDGFFAQKSFLNKIGFQFPKLANFFASNSVTSKLIKNTLGIANDRSLPSIQSETLRDWFRNRSKENHSKKAHTKQHKTLYIFCDEFTNHYDVELGKKAIQLLEKLDYDVRLIDHADSGRGAISKGYLDEAKSMANSLVNLFSTIVNDEVPLIGIEPSAILGFRDEIPRLVDRSLVDKSINLSKNVFTIEEFLFQEISAGNIRSDHFSEESKTILVHGHCHQKALSNISKTAFILSLPSSNKVSIIPSGCCGMAGSFGYEKEHYKVSMQVGELVLFPTVRNATKDTIIAAAGTSCRHQIKDGTDRSALHPLEILFESLV